MTLEYLNCRDYVRGFFVFAFISFSSCLSAANPVQSHDVSGIYIGMPAIDVLHTLGPPETAQYIFPLKDHIDYVYPSLTVTLGANGPRIDSPKIVTNIESTTDLHCFQKTVCPGDSLSAIQTIMGDTHVEPPNYGRPARLLYPFPELETCWLEVFTYDKQKASGIMIACQP